MRAISLIQTAVLVLALCAAGCAGRDAEPPNVPPGQVTEAPPTPPPSPDGTDPR